MNPFRKNGHPFASAARFTICSLGFVSLCSSTSQICIVLSGCTQAEKEWKDRNQHSVFVQIVVHLRGSLVLSAQFCSAQSPLSCSYPEWLGNKESKNQELDCAWSLGLFSTEMALMMQCISEFLWSLLVEDKYIQCRMYTALPSSACHIILFALYSHTFCVYTYRHMYMPCMLCIYTCMCGGYVYKPKCNIHSTAWSSVWFGWKQISDLHDLSQTSFSTEDVKVMVRNRWGKNSFLHPLKFYFYFFN